MKPYLLLLVLLVLSAVSLDFATRASAQHHHDTVHIDVYNIGGRSHNAETSSSSVIVSSIVFIILFVFIFALCSLTFFPDGNWRPFSAMTYDYPQQGYKHPKLEVTTETSFDGKK